MCKPSYKELKAEIEKLKTGLWDIIELSFTSVEIDDHCKELLGIETACLLCRNKGCEICKGEKP